MGIALVPADLVSGALLSGALEHVLPDYTVIGEEMELCLAYPSREYVSASCRTFIDYCVEILAHCPAPAEEHVESGADPRSGRSHDSAGRVS
jgi:DNA-binding transcriptional LysR family regulator